MTVMRTIGIIFNILTFIWMLITLKSIRYIRREDIYAYDIDKKPIAVKEYTTWEKAWHTPKLPVGLWILLVVNILVPYLGALVYIIISSFSLEYYDEKRYYLEKTKLRLKMESITNKIKKPFELIINLMSKEI